MPASRRVLLEAENGVFGLFGVSRQGQRKSLKTAGTMKYAIIADIHAHPAALKAVLRDAEQQGCTHTACLGDLVGYWDKPKECVDIIRTMGIPCVKGNHDEYCSSDTNLQDFNPRMVEVIRWTREQLTEDQRNWLRNLALVEVPKATYATYDLAEKSVELRRVECPPPGFPPIPGSDFPIPPQRVGGI